MEMMEWLGDLQAQVGKRSEEISDTFHVGPAERYRLTFDPDSEELAESAFLPPGRHGLYFLPRLDKPALRPDGTPNGAGVIPDIPMPRRMFAAEEVEFHRPIRFGETLARRTVLTDVQRKTGSSGELLFATVTHDIGDALTVRQHTVFRHEAQGAQADAAAGARKRTALGTPTWRKSMYLDEVDLFRFSALTWNSHRIHYDRPWAVEREGYPDLVVHGPLLSMLMLDFGVGCLGTSGIKSYRMRAMASVFCNRPFELMGHRSGQGVEVAAVDDDGQVAMRAHLSC